jgi:hypothetical protein
MILRGEILGLFCPAGETYRPTAFIHAWGHFTAILPLQNESNCFWIQGEQQLQFAGTLLLGKNSTAPPAAISIQILMCKLPLEHGCTYCCHLLSLILAVTAFCTFAWLETITVTKSMLWAI